MKLLLSSIKTTYLPFLKGQPPLYANINTMRKHRDITQTVCLSISLYMVDCTRCVCVCVCVCEWFTQPQPRSQGHTADQNSQRSIYCADWCLSDRNNIHTKSAFIQLQLTKSPTLVLYPRFKKTADKTLRRWTFHVFSVCDSQSDWGLITATLLLLIPSDPLPPLLLIRFLWLGYLSSPALTVSDAWLMGLAFKSAGLMRQNPNKACHSCGGISSRGAEIRRKWHCWNMHSWHGCFLHLVRFVAILKALTWKKESFFFSFWSTWTR